jgi:uncharacterized protein YyaL (SSP411 family)
VQSRTATNHLKGEKSPYLAQHAANPVDWYPWSTEATKRAKDEDKPMLISIGYSTCHWCHVMARESFEDAETARVMNENFINIKVDREERPDLDSLYMKAVQAMNGHGGWPLTVFTTPEGVPFYGGTYFPPDDRSGLPSFKKVLAAVSRAYRENRETITTVTDQIVGALKGRDTQRVELSKRIPDDAFESARNFFDPVNGGFGMGTKFPYAMFLKFLLAYSKRTGLPEPMEIVKKTLSAMASGGLYDHLAGGFHRYTVDERWEVPHFEKMLYDNAQLGELYSLAYEATGIEFYKDVAEETIEYLLRDMRSPEGGFYSAEDADVEGSEGEYYVWSVKDVEEVLGSDDAVKFVEYYSVTEDGNFEGKNTLRINPELKSPDERVSAGMKGFGGKLFEARKKRTAPDKDRKAITGWNSLVISALVEASRAFNRPDLLTEAERSARFLLDSVRNDDGRLLRYYLDGGADAFATLEDHALLGSALVSIHEASGDKGWLKEAEELATTMKDLFFDKGIYHDTGRDQDKLFVRARDLFDNDVPSGSSAAADFLMKLGRVKDDNGLKKSAEEIIASIEGLVDEPMYHGAVLSALEATFSEGAAPLR